MSSIWYVNAGNPDGSGAGTSGHGGTSWADAKDTLAHGMALASAGDTIMCQGIFTEDIPATVAVNWIGFGQCVFSGAGSPGNNPSFSNIIFSGATGVSIGESYSMSARFFDCTFKDQPGAVWMCENCSLFFTNCRFYNLSTAAIEFSGLIGSGLANSSAINCEFYNNGTDILFNGTTGLGMSASLCCFGSPVMINGLGFTYMANSDNNVFDFANGKCIYGGADKTSLSAWRTTVSPNDANSIDRVWRTDVGDYANNALRPNPASFLLTAAPGGTPIGLTHPALTISNNTNSSYWTGGVFVDTSVDGSGYLVLNSGHSIGTWASDVIDLGANINTAAIEVGVIGEDATHFLDTDLSDSPGYISVEFRGQTTSFVKTLSEGTLAYTVIPRGAELGAYLSPNALRYVQVRLTLNGS